MISALLVAIVVVGTLSGFDAVNRTTTDQRQHNQAALLAAESQEHLRSVPATSLELLETSPFSYTRTTGGTTYTITQKAELQPASGSSGGCSVIETERQSGNAFRITSTVTWTTQKQAKRPALVASSVITPPTGSALEVDADNAPAVTAGVSGVTAIVKYTPSGGSGTVTLEQTTGAAGCVVFAGIPSTSALVEIRELSGFVTRSGATSYPTEEVKIAPNYTTHHAVYYNKAGAITATFAYNGKTSYKHTKNSGVGELEEAVAGDTFVAFNSQMESAPDFEVGSTRYNAATTVYNPIPGTYEATATTPTNLFPFTEKETSWAAYAGDCTENNPNTVTSGKVTYPSKVYVSPGATTSATIPTSHVQLNLYTKTESQVNAMGSKAWEALETTTSRAVTVTNSACAESPAPNNESAVSLKHTVTAGTTTGAENGGHLTRPFLPFTPEAQLCVYVSPNAYMRNYEATTLAGPTLPIYLGQKSTQEKATLKTTEVKAEETTKTNRETTEQTERNKWKTQETKKEISNAERKAKEKAQETARIPLIAAEEATKTARENKEKEEAKEAENSKVTVETRASCP